jgi:hypothetical protein|uniref:Uncharacterized protein n=1 Tax=Picea glauca TaxID=3330 RepID=A0A101LWD1_PICGL|nr:hypothetical protein ABT39_MTgene1657 [Picea glauca]QHR87940.1 hypothetical protein Q903MT_gene1952 [Picea sitchensis]
MLSIDPLETGADAAAIHMLSIQEFMHSMAFGQFVNRCTMLIYDAPVKIGSCARQTHSESE